jgi:serine/threonine-protein kinase RsbW
MEQLKTDIINELLKGNKVAWHNMFSLNLTQKAARLRQIPLTSKAVFIPPQQSIQFKPGKGLKQQINLGVKEKNVFIISPDPDKFQELTKELTGNKITVSIFASVNELKERITTLKNISVTVIDFPPHLPEYDEITFSLKRNTTLSLIGLIGLIPPDYDPLKISDLKIMCDRWIKNSMSLSELKEAILSDVSRTDEERVFFNNRLNLRLPSDNQHTEKLDILMEELVGRTKFKSEKKYEFISAIKEAIMNGARHGNKYDQNKFVDVEYLIDKQKITFTITDEGPGFDFETHLRKTEKDSQEILKETRDKPSENGAGFGIVLMKKCVDELIYLPPGNIVSLVKYFKPDKKS